MQKVRGDRSVEVSRPKHEGPKQHLWEFLRPDPASGSAPKLPGKLSDSGLKIEDDPRLDPSIAKMMKRAALPFPTINRSSPLAEQALAIQELERSMPRRVQRPRAGSLDRCAVHYL